MASLLKAAKQPNPEYVVRAQKHLTIDENKMGHVFCMVPSEENTEFAEHGVRYRVVVSFQTTVPHPYHCECWAFKKDPTRACKHMYVVSVMYTRIYKSNVEKLQAKQEAKKAVKSNVSPMKQWINKEISTPELAKQVMGTPSSQREDWTTSTALNGNRGFQLMK